MLGLGGNNNETNSLTAVVAARRGGNNLVLGGLHALGEWRLVGFMPFLMNFIYVLRFSLQSQGRLTEKLTPDQNTAQWPRDRVMALTLKNNGLA